MKGGTEMFLVKQAQRGDADAFVALIEKYKMDLYKVAKACLKNEEETYEYLNSRLPAVGDFVTTEDGLKGEVQSVNVLRQLVKVVVDVEDEKEIREYKVDQLKFKPRRKKGKGGEKQDEAELKKLEALEKREGKSRLNDK